MFGAPGRVSLLGVITRYHNDSDNDTVCQSCNSLTFRATPRDKTVQLDNQLQPLVLPQPSQT